MLIEVVAAIIFYENKVLVTQRKFNENIDFSFKFEFPGGKVEKGEKKLIALKRELLEELDLELNILNILKVININITIQKYSCIFI